MIRWHALVVQALDVREVDSVVSYRANYLDESYNPPHDALPHLLVALSSVIFQCKGVIMSDQKAPEAPGFSKETSLSWTCSLRFRSQADNLVLAAHAAMLESGFMPLQDVPIFPCLL